MTAGIVAWRDHPLFAGSVAPEDLARYPWIDFDWPAPASLDETRPSLAAILAQLRGAGAAGIVTVLRLGAAGLLRPGRRPLARLALDGAAGAPARRPRPAPAGRHRALPLPLRIRRPALGRGPAAVPGAGGGRARHGARAGRADRLSAGLTEIGRNGRALARQVSTTAPCAAGATSAFRVAGRPDSAISSSTYRARPPVSEANPPRREIAAIGIGRTRPARSPAYGWIVCRTPRSLAARRRPSAPLSPAARSATGSRLNGSSTPPVALDIPVVADRCRRARSARGAADNDFLSALLENPSGGGRNPSHLTR